MKEESNIDLIRESVEEAIRSLYLALEEIDEIQLAQEGKDKFGREKPRRKKND